MGSGVKLYFNAALLLQLAWTMDKSFSFVEWLPNVLYMWVLKWHKQTGLGKIWMIHCCDC